MTVVVTPIVIGALGTDKGTTRLKNQRTSGDHPNWSWRFKETFCHSDSSERPSVNAGVKNSLGIIIIWNMKMTNCNWCARYNHQRIDKETGGLLNKRTSGDPWNDSICNIGQDTKKSPGDLRSFTISQTAVRKHYQMLIWKNFQLSKIIYTNIWFIIIHYNSVRVSSVHLHVILIHVPPRIQEGFSSTFPLDSLSLSFRIFNIDVASSVCSAPKELPGTNFIYSHCIA